MQKIVLIGGSFNPIHLGHLKLISLACQLKDVSKVILMPAYCSPFKQQSEQVAACYRWQLIDLAFEDLLDLEQDFSYISKTEQEQIKEFYQAKRLEILDWEIKANEPSYTWHTLEKLQTLYSECELVLLGGSDLLKDFERWYQVEKILKVATLFVVSRPHYMQAASSLRDKLVSKYKAKIELMNVDMPDISSAELRTELKSVPYAQAYSLIASEINNYYNLPGLKEIMPNLQANFLSKNELAFIAQNRLYQQPNLSSILSEETIRFVNRLINYNLQNLPWKRQSHCLNVMYFAFTLLIAKYQIEAKKAINLSEIKRILEAPWLNFANINLTDEQKQTCEEVVISGLFHDACKYSQLSNYKEVEAKLTEEDINSKIEHGPIAAHVLAKEFGCTNRTIIEAVYYHTTLRAQATLVDKLVYLADKLEFGRTYNDVVSLRASLALGYDETVKRVLRATTKLLESKQQHAHSLSLEALADLEEERN